MATDNKKRSDKDYPHWQLSEQVIGLLFDVFNEFGFGYQERFYQRALAYKLDDTSLAYKREDYGVVTLAGRPIGRYYIDFLIDDKIVLELKVANDFYESHIKQVLSYLKAKNIKVGLLGIITPQGIKLKRLIK